MMGGERRTKGLTGRKNCAGSTNTSIRSLGSHAGACRMVTSELGKVAQWVDGRFPAILAGAIPTLFVIFLLSEEIGQFLSYVVGGAAVIWLTNRRAKAMEDNVSLAQKGQAITRFESAVKLLESKNSAIVVGAVYALHRMATEETEYRRPVFDVLCELIRQGGQEQFQSGRRIAVKVLFSAESEDGQKIYPFEGRLNGAKLKGWDLSGLDFSGSDFEEADLSNVNFRDSNLAAANLTGAEVDRLEVNERTRYRGARFCGVCLSSIDFKGVDMSETDFRATGTSVTQLSFVSFEECDFKDARFDDVKLDGVTFENCKHLTVEQLARARWLRKVKGLGQEVEEALRRGSPHLFEDEDLPAPSQ